MECRVRQVVLALVALCGASAGGCGLVQRVLGMEGNELLQVHDVLTPPGRPCDLRVRLRAGTLLWEQEYRPVRFVLDGQEFALATTDGEGWASARFLPPGPGDYNVIVETQGQGGRLVRQRLLVACRAPDWPIMIVDLDGTALAKGFRQVAVGDPPALPDAAEVLSELTQRYTIVYLTHRLDVLGPKTRKWLDEHRFPPGPIVLAGLGEAINGARRYKTEALRRMRQDFTRIEIGVGDQVSDADAYAANGLQTYFVLHNPSALGDVRDAVKHLRDIKPPAQVVCNWRQVRQGVLEGRQFPAADAVERCVSGVGGP